MKSYTEYRKMDLSEYDLDEHWLANRLMFLWNICDVNPTRYSVLKLNEEEEYLRTIKGIDHIAFSRRMDAPYDRTIHRWRDNYFDLTIENHRL